jgi:hypothetical protein
MKNKGLFSSLVLGTILAAGFLTVWGAIGVVALENGRMIVLRNRAESVLMIRADGTAVIAQESHGATSYRGLDGVPVAIAEDDPLGWFNGSRLPSSLPWRKDDGEWDQRARVFSDGRSPHTAWYFVTDGRPDGKAYFVGYDSYGKRRVGYLGLAGFRAELPSAEEQFPFAGATTGIRTRVICPSEDGRPRRIREHGGAYQIGPSHAKPGLVYVLGLDDTIYQADLRKRTVRIAVQQHGLRSLAELDDVTDPNHSNWRLAARTDTVVLVLNKHGEVERHYPIPEELREKPFLFGETTTGEAVMRWEQEGDVLAEERVSSLFWVRPDGQIRTVAVTLPSEPFRELRYVMAALLPSPLALDGVGVLRSQQLQEDGLTPTFASAVVRTWEEFWPAAVLAQLLALGLAILCYRRQRRYGVGSAERIAWPLFVLLLGLPGWIGYRFCRKWPVLESCPECGVAVPRDRESCLRCANDFPAAALRGTEVFA